MCLGAHSSALENPGRPTQSRKCSEGTIRTHTLQWGDWVLLLSLPVEGLGSKGNSFVVVCTQATDQQWGVLKQNTCLLSCSQWGLLPDLEGKSWQKEWEPYRTLLPQMMSKAYIRNFMTGACCLMQMRWCPHPCPHSLYLPSLWKRAELIHRSHFLGELSPSCSQATRSSLSLFLPLVLMDLWPRLKGKREPPQKAALLTFPTCPPCS